MKDWENHGRLTLPGTIPEEKFRFEGGRKKKLFFFKSPIFLAPALNGWVVKVSMLFTTSLSGPFFLQKYFFLPILEFSFFSLTFQVELIRLVRECLFTL